MTQQYIPQEIDLDFNLNADELIQQIEDESTMAVEVTTSMYTTSTFTQQDGTTRISNQWLIEYKRLDRDLGDMVFRTRHSLPDVSSDRPVTNREGRSYARNILAWNRMGIKGNKPADFLGVRCWVKEQIDQPGSQFEKKWWMPKALYTEGQSFEEAIGGAMINSATDINPPTVNSNGTTPENTEETSVSIEEGSDYDLLIETIEGKTHRAAVTAVGKVEQLSNNEELMLGVNSGSLFDKLLDDSVIEERDGKYYRVV